VTLTIELPEDLAARLTRNADQDLINSYAVAIFEQLADALEEHSRKNSRNIKVIRPYLPGRSIAAAQVKPEYSMSDEPAHKLTWNEFVAAMAEGLDTPDRQPLSDYAVSRAGIYEDHP
jgi:hypothetical protein